MVQAQKPDLCDIVYDYEDYITAYQVETPIDVKFLTIEYADLDSMFDIVPELINGRLVKPILKGVTIVHKRDSVFYTTVYISNTLVDSNEIRLVTYHELSHAFFIEEHSYQMFSFGTYYMYNPNHVRLMEESYSRDHVDECYVEEVIHEYFNYRRQL